MDWRGTQIYGLERDTNIWTGQGHKYMDLRGTQIYGLERDTNI